MENREITNCNQCPNHCPADALRCGRGRQYFEQLENPDAANAEGSTDYGHREGHGHGEGHSHGGGHAKPDDLYGLMRACGHYLHHNDGERAALFDGLDEAEQESLKGLLKKLVDSWE